MANLKELQVRIKSIKSTRKITSAMKMVAAARLRRAQEGMQHTSHYAKAIRAAALNAARALARKVENPADLPPLLKGGDKRKVHLVVVISSDRGLCGGFNSGIAKKTRQVIGELQSQGKSVRLFFSGRKAKDLLRSEYGSMIITHVDNAELNEKAYRYESAVGVKVLSLFQNGDIDECTVVYGHFKSAISQEAVAVPLIPLFTKDELYPKDEKPVKEADYDYYPNLDDMSADLFAAYFLNAAFRYVLESLTSENAARMTSMDSSTRNAGDMIGRLSLEYNRTRQSVITNELIEIISGAEAL